MGYTIESDSDQGAITLLGRDTQNASWQPNALNGSSGSGPSKKVATPSHERKFNSAMQNIERQPVDMVDSGGNLMDDADQRHGHTRLCINMLGSGRSCINTTDTVQKRMMIGNQTNTCFSFEMLAMTAPWLSFVLVAESKQQSPWCWWSHSFLQKNKRSSRHQVQVVIITIHLFFFTASYSCVVFFRSPPDDYRHCVGNTVY